MRIVVNHLTFAAPIGPEVRAAADEGGRRVVAAGGHGLDFVQVDDTHAFLVLRFPDLETEERITQEIGGPFMREHIVPLLAGPTQRTSGAVVAGASG